MRIETATEPGRPEVPNEDFVSVVLPAGGRGGALVLLDGVTPPPDNGGCAHSVPWFTARLGGALLELAVSRPDLTLKDCLSAAISRTADAHRTSCDLSHPLTPQATVVAVRWDGAELEHLVLSDSALLLESVDGTVTPVLDDRIDRLRAAGLRVAPLRNTEGGFFTAAADPAVAARAVTGRTPTAALRAVAAVTDGAARGVEVFGSDDWPGLFALLRKAGPQALIARVRERENADPAGTAVPRGKPYDDATAVLVEF
ncbi:hypothetical protein GA0115240_15102 [Streptomyces sp. DvalAA-14]|uniref:hypothetical protein n=1 Tax=unclassified Streptomyces TaxID=2593676 RepID=UPI00081B92DF|nr:MULTISPECIES: hypothetical protein [unclassified Streptomyces]MYS23285.1 hypothetical protein [Streptomyces sp. SID4948]SCE30889.1 hypothetical protein GA0115240_15102 [Streptomyces sp. DvalAA-14]